MRLLIHDTLITSPFTMPISQRWLESPLPVETRASLAGGDLTADDVAFLPAAEIASLHDTHHILPDFAAVSFQRGAIAMRVPVRPDEIRVTPVRLWHASSSAEMLARATLHPFYGITPTTFTSSNTAEAQVVILEGSEALQAPEAGFSEDLVRAWFILTEQPFVSHIVVAPKALDRQALAPALSTLSDLRLAGHERRKEVRRAIAETAQLEPNVVTDFFLAQRYTLEPNDRRSLLMLLQRGNRGSALPYVWDVSYVE